MKNTGYLGKINYTDMSLTDKGTKVEITSDLSRPALWVAHPESYEVVYPRIKFSSMNLKVLALRPSLILLNLLADSPPLDFR